MAEGGGVLRRLVAIIGLDFQKNDFDKADMAIRGVKSHLNELVGLVAGSLIANGFKSMVLGAVDAADQIETTAKKLGLSTDALQELQFAAKMSNVNSESLGGSLKFLARNAAEAANGSKEARGAFGDLGIGVTDAQGKILPTEDLLTRVASAMEGVNEPAERVRLAMKLFGRDGASIIPMLAEGSAGLNAMRQEARDLGGMFDPEFVEQAAVIDDNLKRLEASFQGMKNMVVAQVLPALNSIVKAMISGWKNVKEWLKGTNVVKVVLIALAAVSAAAAFMLTSKLLVALGGVAEAGIKAALGLGAAGKASLLMQIKSMLLGGALLVLAGLAILLGDELITAFQGGDTLLGRMYDKLMKADFSNSPFRRFLRWMVDCLHDALNYAFAITAYLMGDDGRLKAMFPELHGDYSGVKGKNYPMPGELTKDPTKLRQGDFRKLDKKDYGFFKSVVRTALGAADAYGVVKDAPLEPLVPTVPASSSAVMNSSNRSAVSSPVMNFSQTINALPGQDAQAIGEAAAKSSRDVWQSMIDDARTGLLPLSPSNTGG